MLHVINHRENCELITLMSVALFWRISKQPISQIQLGTVIFHLGSLLASWYYLGLSSSSQDMQPAGPIVPIIPLIIPFSHATWDWALHGLWHGSFFFCLSPVATKYSSVFLSLNNTSFVLSEFMGLEISSAEIMLLS